jgi:solute carrier family 25 carnitine/acylcarnitine transporter 20/29
MQGRTTVLAMVALQATLVLSLWPGSSFKLCTLLFWALTYPTDVIKSTLQSDELERSQRKYNGIIDCAKKMYYNEGGMKRFWRGFSPCLLRAIPANAAMLYTVERARQFLNPYI